MVTITVRINTGSLHTSIGHSEAFVEKVAWKQTDVKDKCELWGEGQWKSGGFRPWGVGVKDYDAFWELIWFENVWNAYRRSGTKDRAERIKQSWDCEDPCRVCEYGLWELRGAVARKQWDQLWALKNYPGSSLRSNLKASKAESQGQTDVVNFIWEGICTKRAQACQLDKAVRKDKFQSQVSKSTVYLMALLFWKSKQTTSWGTWELPPTHSCLELELGKLGIKIIISSSSSCSYYQKDYT